MKITGTIGRNQVIDNRRAARIEDIETLAITAHRNPGAAGIIGKQRAIGGWNADPIKSIRIKRIGDDKSGIAEDHKINPEPVPGMIEHRPAEFDGQGPTAADRK